MLGASRHEETAPSARWSRLPRTSGLRCRTARGRRCPPRSSPGCPIASPPCCHPAYPDEAAARWAALGYCQPDGTFVTTLADLRQWLVEMARAGEAVCVDRLATRVQRPSGWVNQKVLYDAKRHAHTAQGLAVSTIWGDLLWCDGGWPFLVMGVADKSFHTSLSAHLPAKIGRERRVQVWVEDQAPAASSAQTYGRLRWDRHHRRGADPGSRYAVKSGTRRDTELGGRACAWSAAWRSAGPPARSGGLARHDYRR